MAASGVPPLVGETWVAVSWSAGSKAELRRACGRRRPTARTPPGACSARPRDTDRAAPGGPGEVAAIPEQRTRGAEDRVVGDAGAAADPAHHAAHRGGLGRGRMPWRGGHP